MRLPVSRLAILAGAALLLSCRAPAVPAPVTPVAGATRGTLFIVGGGSQSRELVAHFVALAGGPGRARIAIFPMASEESAESGRDKAADLRNHGADAYVLDLTRAQAMTDSAAALVAGATGIWFPGGDQARLTGVLRGTPVLRAIMARYQAGAVIGGTSAGAAIMSDSMITGDQFKPGVDTAGYYEDEYPRIARHTIVIAAGFGFLHGAIVDQHFIRRERANRLLGAVLEHPAMLGIGIDEGTALRVDPDGRWTIEGASAAMVFDARHAAVTGTTAPRLGASAITLHLLPAGSTFDPTTGRATLPPS